jgi:LacI family transcriptional regulator
MPHTAHTPGESLAWRADRTQPVVIVSAHADDRLDEARLRELLDEADRRGWRLMDFEFAEGLFVDDKPDGAIVIWLPTPEVSSRLKELGCPTVRIGRLPDRNDAHAPAILPDHREAGRLAADYFVARGFRHLALVGHQAMRILPAVEQGFGERADAHGCLRHHFYFQSPQAGHTEDMTKEQRWAYREGKLIEWLTSLPKPVGLLSCTSPLGAAACRICLQHGIAVPEEVAVMVLGDLPAPCELAAVPLSSVDMSRGEMARTAVRLLDQMIRGESVPTHTYVRPRGVITRRSTDILAIEHPLVARTVRFLWDHLDRDLSVDQVAREMRTSRYRLERLFRQHFRRGINTELRRARLERFRELLRTTDLTIAELAPRVGFNSDKFLHRTFRNLYGLTPRQYRLQARQRGDEEE